MDAEEIKRKQEILTLLQRRKHELDKQVAIFGPSVDPNVTIQQQDLATQMEQIHQEIQSLADSRVNNNSSKEQKLEYQNRALRIMVNAYSMIERFRDIAASLDEKKSGTEFVATLRWGCEQQIGIMKQAIAVLEQEANRFTL
jgi:hypothetical protein